jgi:hypothetical protein
MELALESVSDARLLEDNNSAESDSDTVKPSGSPLSLSCYA